MFDFQFQKINSTVNIQQNIYGKFLVFPVTNGHGITIGNALRRVLLSDLSGIAIIGVKILGIKHEFSTIAGIREDVLEILLNLKQVTFTGTLFDNIVVPLEIQGPKIITADNIQLPSNLQIVNPNHYITAICANVFLCMELEIASGTGYKLANPSSCNVKSDFIELDAIFMPVQKVNYYVENIYIKSLKLKENLIIEIWTNGSVTPEIALKNSSQILINLFSVFTNANIKSENTNITRKINSIRIEELNLSTRAYNGLKRAKINSLDDLLKYSLNDLKKLQNFGQKSVQEVRTKAKTYFGIILKHK
jgi:DNA-directed RNA polymerase subunit alpha